MVMDRTKTAATNQADFVNYFLGIGSTVTFKGDWIELCGVSCKDGTLKISEKGLEFARGTQLKR